MLSSMSCKGAIPKVHIRRGSFLTRYSKTFHNSTDKHRDCGSFVPFFLSQSIAEKLNQPATLYTTYQYQSNPYDNWLQRKYI